MFAPRRTRQQRGRHEFNYVLHAEEVAAAQRFAADSALGAELRRCRGVAPVGTMLSERHAVWPYHDRMCLTRRFVANSMRISDVGADLGRSDRMYNARYTSEGTMLVTASNGDQLAVFDVANGYRLRAEIPARQVSWTITSIDIHSSSLIYSTMSSRLHLVRLGNILDGSLPSEQPPPPPAAPGRTRAAAAASSRGASHHSLQAARHLGQSLDHVGIDLGGANDEGFRVFQSVFGADGNELIAACSHNRIIVYDLNSVRVTESILAHEDDINTCTFADQTTRSNILISGSDDALIKVWDRRLMSTCASSGAASGGSRGGEGGDGSDGDSDGGGVPFHRRYGGRGGGSSTGGRARGLAEPSGVLLGHIEGITSLCAKGDGHTILSNSKDQTAKLWDLRKMSSPARQCIQQSVRDDGAVPRYADEFDYRMSAFPGIRAPPVRLKADSSLMTYRGHSVLRTLIRATFSAAEANAQSFVHSGSADGRIYTYDALTGELVSVLRGHEAEVRDVSAHPFNGQLASASWDGSCAVWDYNADAAEEQQAEREQRRAARARTLARSGGGGGGSSGTAGEQEGAEEDVGDGDSGLRRSARLRVLRRGDTPGEEDDEDEDDDDGEPGGNPMGQWLSLLRGGGVLAQAVAAAIAARGWRGTAAAGGTGDADAEGEDGDDDGAEGDEAEDEGDEVEADRR